MTDKTIQRLEELLELKDQDNQRLQDELDAIHAEKDDLDWSWARHQKVDSNHLPVPRLQLKLIDNSDFSQTWQVGLVVQDWGKQRLVPLSQSTRSGGSLLQEGETMPELVTYHIDELRNILPMLYVDFRKQLESFGNLPGYLVIEDKTWKCNGTELFHLV